MPRFFIIYLNCIALLMLSSCFLEPLPFDEKKWLETVDRTDPRDVYKDNKRDERYINPWLEQDERSFAAFLRWRFSRTPPYNSEAKNNKPEVIPDLIERINLLDPAVNFITWIGHATFLFRIDGEYWLTDPIFTDRALLPKRITPPAIRGKDLAKISGKLNVMISHNHYDHLDAASIRAIPQDASIYVPVGLGGYVGSLSQAEVITMNWWQEIHLTDEVQLTCLPAQHWSLRLFQGYNTTLWASYMVSTPGLTIYFGGDSGYFKGYSEIGKKFEDIDYALLPITAYDPRWFMHYPHMNTSEAIRAFHDLGAKYFIPTQWGTFHLGDNPPGLPPLDLKRDIDRMQLDSAPFIIMDIGEIRIL